MTSSEKISYIKAISDERDEDVISAFLAMAEEIAYNKVFPFRERTEATTKYMERYSSVICELAVYLLNKRGAEGEISHNENSVDRTYEDAGVPTSIMRKLTPYCGVVS